MEIKKVTITSTPKILTVNQLEHIVNGNRFSIYQLTKKISKRTGETFLDVCYPFPDNEDDPISGPAFIIRNEKCEKYIDKCLRRKPTKKVEKPAPKTKDLDTFMLGPKELFTKFYKHHLGVIVQFDDYTEQLATEIYSIFSKGEIESAFKNVKNSFHKKNGYRLFTLEYFLKPDQISKWSQIK